VERIRNGPIDEVISSTNYISVTRNDMYRLYQIFIG